MDFAAVWEALDIGAETMVSNGRPAPSTNVQGLAYKVWQSHNFTGALVEKIVGPPRGLRFTLTNDAGNEIGYTVQEGVGHAFDAGQGGRPWPVSRP